MHLSLEHISSKIYIIRWQKVILDRDLAQLYGVETKYLKRQVRRNIDRFPEDFMFELTEQEFRTMRWHFGASNTWNTLNKADRTRWHFGTLNTWRWKNIKYPPSAFTEYGCLQAANILRSQQAKKMSVAIIRVFVHMRQRLSDHEHLRKLVLENEDEIRKIRFELEKLNFEQERENRTHIWFNLDDDW